MAWHNLAQTPLGAVFKSTGRKNSNTHVSLIAYGLRFAQSAYPLVTLDDRIALTTTGIARLHRKIHCGVLVSADQRSSSWLIMVRALSALICGIAAGLVLSDGFEREAREDEGDMEKWDLAQFNLRDDGPDDLTPSVSASPSGSASASPGPAFEEEWDDQPHSDDNGLEPEEQVFKWTPTPSPTRRHSQSRTPWPHWGKLDPTVLAKFLDEAAQNGTLRGDSSSGAAPLAGSSFVWQIGLACAVAAFLTATS